MLRDMNDCRAVEALVDSNISFFYLLSSEIEETQKLTY